MIHYTLKKGRGLAGSWGIYSYIVPFFPFSFRSEGEKRDFKKLYLRFCIFPWYITKNEKGLRFMLIIQKYGGTSVGSLDRIRAVAERIGKIKRTVIHVCCI